MKKDEDRQVLPQKKYGSYLRADGLVYEFSLRVAIYLLLVSLLTWVGIYGVINYLTDGGFGLWTKGFMSESPWWLRNIVMNVLFFLPPVFGIMGSLRYIVLKDRPRHDGEGGLIDENLFLRYGPKRQVTEEQSNGGEGDGYEGRERTPKEPDTN